MVSPLPKAVDGMRLARREVRVAQAAPQDVGPTFRSEYAAGPVNVVAVADHFTDSTTRLLGAAIGAR